MEITQARLILSGKNNRSKTNFSLNHTANSVKPLSLEEIGKIKCTAHMLRIWGMESDILQEII